MIQPISPNDDLVLDIVLTDKSGNIIEESLIANLQFVVFTEDTSELQRVYLSKTRYNEGKLHINSSELESLSSGQLYLTTAIALLNSKYNDGSFDYIKTSALPYYLKNSATSVSDDEAILKWKIDVTKSLQNIETSLSDFSTRLRLLEMSSGGETAEDVITDIVNNALADYATKDYVDSQDASLAANIHPEVDLTGYATEQYVDNKVDNIDIPVVDLEPYALKSSIPSVEGLATEQYVDNKVADVSVDLSGYATSADVSTALASKADKTEIPSLDGYATEQYVDASINAIPQPDLTPYATSADVSTALASKADKTEIPSLDGYATEQYVDEHDASVANTIPSIEGLATETFVTQQVGNIDLTPYATSADVSTALANKADKTEIPSLEGYATEQYVDASINAIPQPDLTPYATSADVSTALASKADASVLDNYVTDSSLSSTLNNYTSHTEMENVESAVATAVNRLAERVENIESTLMEDSSTGEESSTGNDSSTGEDSSTGLI